MSYRLEDPTTGEVLETFDTLTDEQAVEAVERAHAAYLPGAPPASKSAPLSSTASPSSSKSASRNWPKPSPRRWVSPSQRASKKPNSPQPSSPTTPGSPPTTSKTSRFPQRPKLKAYIQRKPLGALLGIMPWNFPYYQVARFAAPNLMLGNTIVLKHAEICPKSALVIAEIMKDAGLPEGAYEAVFASHDQIETMIGHRHIQGVSLTGSGTSWCYRCRYCRAQP